MIEEAAGWAARRNTVGRAWCPHAGSWSKLHNILISSRFISGKVLIFTFSPFKRLGLNLDHDLYIKKKLQFQKFFLVCRDDSEVNQFTFCFVNSS